VRLAHAKAQLQGWKHDAIQQGVRDVDTMLTEGSAWDRLCAIARDDRSIELVVVGTHGRTGVSRALIGSVAERVVRHAPCSVMVVRSRT
jgi:nucleotide-binding universal stress UspA family protein